ncbi:hypothetical protein [Noviherbaspirillum malthae]|uniref:hypothetical protein n=1 Tax=Noviherbaspirillum malthae TaxID=1260987 RepID=UPI00188E4E9B|nr:hypothetical protein [Noviherbaspirillum malthae]
MTLKVPKKSCRRQIMSPPPDEIGARVMPPPTVATPHLRAISYGLSMAVRILARQLACSARQLERIPRRDAGLTNCGRVHWKLLEQAMDAALLVRFLQRLVRDAQRKASLMLDNLPTHYGPPVVTWVEQHRGCNDVLSLPS